MINSEEFFLRFFVNWAQAFSVHNKTIIKKDRISRNNECVQYAASIKNVYTATVDSQ